MSPFDPDLRALQEVRDAVGLAKAAQRIAAGWSQSRTDEVCATVVRAAAGAAHELARVAVEETGMGRVHYKVLKNLFASEGTWASIRDEKTVGVIHRDAAAGLVEVGSPVGVVAGIIPTTNPTSTVINNTLINLKARNAIVFSPHPRAKRCIGETVEVMRRAVERAGGPADLISSLSNPTVESTAALMKHRDVAMILATGGSGLVRAAYSSGKPAYGVGPGNVPVYIDRTADIATAARWLVASQSFDNGTLCCSEQALVLDRPIADKLLAELCARGAHLASEEETRKLEARCVVDGLMSPDVVGQDPYIIAERSGFSVPRATTVLLAHQAGVGKAFPLSGEVLCPLLSIHVVDGWEAGCETSLAILRFGGLGHTIGLWARDEEILDAWFVEKPASRIVVNGPTSQGAVGYSTGLVPAMSLGCGPHAGNITSDNISARHMLNVKRAGFMRQDWEERYASDMQRAATFTGESAPRGSGLAGDVGLFTGQRVGRAEAKPASSTRAQLASRTGTEDFVLTPPVTYSEPQPSRSTPASQSAPRAAVAQARLESISLAAAPAPRFAASAPHAVAAPPPPRKTRAASPKLAQTTSAMDGGPYVGMSLTQGEIEGILSNAGAGCPLGPCQGCPHNDSKTGACLA